MKTMLLVFAHPDDETISCGGVIPKYRKNGWDIHLLCATRGEIGNRGQYGTLTDDELGAVRQKELERAGQILGISTITFLGYKDGSLPKLTAGELEDVVYKKMAEVAADVVITYEPNGVTNHPDHIKLTLATTYAFQKYAHRITLLPKLATLKGIIVRDLTREFRKSYSECLDKEDESRLYYACMPQSVVVYLQKKHALPMVSFDKPWVGVADKFITTVIDIKQYRTVKIRALREHQTQREDFEDEIAIERNPTFLKEFFILRMQGVYEVFMGNNDRVKDRL